MNVLKRRITIAALALLCVLPASGEPARATPAPATGSAAEPAPQVDGVATVIRYTGCALGIAGSRDSVGLFGALLYCALLLHDALQ